MGFYSMYNMEEDEDDCFALSPKEKEAVVTTLLDQCSSLTLRELFETIECHDILPDILQKAEADIDDDNSKHFLDLYEQMSQLELFVYADDGDSFSQFLDDNPEFVVAFPPAELFRILCCRCSAACVQALINSSLADHLDANRFPPHCSSSPLETAARHLYLPLTRTLLSFGADVHYTPPTLPTPLTSALTYLWVRVKPVQSTDTRLFYLLSSKKLREGVEIIYLLAEASCPDFERMLMPVVLGCASKALALLLVIALPLIMCPPSDGPWSMDNTPVAIVLSSLPRPYLFEVNKAWCVLKSVWDMMPVKSYARSISISRPLVSNKNFLLLCINTFRYV